MKKMYNLRAMMLFVALFFMSTVSLFGQIGLTATGGTTTATYTTISAAFAAINAGTHQGDIVISVNGNTTEPAAPVYLNATGMASTLFTSVLIKPTVVATIAGTPNAGAGVINFNGSDNVTIDGSIAVGGTTRDLTIQNNNLATVLNTAAIRMIGWTTGGMGVTNMTIKNNVIIGSTPGNNGTSGSTNTSSYGIYAGSNALTTMTSFSAGANYDNITVENNEVKKAHIGIHFYGGTGTSTNDSLVIKNNTIGSTVAADEIGLKGINVYFTVIGLIEGNTIFNVKSTTFTNTMAIEIGGAASSAITISKNRMEAIYSESVSGYGAYGVNLIGGNNHVVVNNVITDVKTVNYSINSTTWNAFGIRIISGTGHKIYYNSVNLYGNLTIGANPPASAALVVTSTVSTGLDIRNNIFSNKTSSAMTSQEHSAVWFPAGYNFQTTTMNNNYYGVPMDAFHFVGKTGTTPGAGLYSGLAPWQAISQVNNATNDVQSRPITNLVAPYTTDLNLTIPAGTITAIESGGVEITSLGVPNTDFLGATRPGTGGTAPDMGAYEGAYAVITCPQPPTIGISVATLNSATVNWTAGGTETAWQLQHGAVGFTPGTGIITNVGTNPATLTALSGLVANSFYHVYVRAICGAGDTSLWTGPVVFNTYGQGQYMEADTQCPTGGFTNISATGTLHTFTSTSQAVGLTLPFPVLYQGQLQNAISLTNSGVVTFNTVTFFSNFNAAITSATVNGLFAHWDAMQIAGMGVYSQTIGTAPNRKFIVQWNAALVFNSQDKVNVQLVIDEATQEIYYVYDDVNVGDPAFNNGASATIGVAGPNQDIQLSFNNASYLTNNSCAHFYYTNCARPVNLTYSYITPDEVAFTWTAGLANETAWTIVYGPAGFNPLTGGTTVSATTASATLPNLNQNTQYDVYIYANCSTTLSSAALVGTFLTAPFCANPGAMTNTAAVDTINAAWTWTSTFPGFDATGFNLMYGVTGFPLYSGTEVSVGNVLTDTIADANLLGGGVYQVYVQAVCGADTSQYVGPFSITMPLTNDSVCGAEMLQVDGTVYTFNNTGATVQAGETTIAPPATGAQTTTGWIASGLNLTTWFKFVAPASGNIRVNQTNLTYAGKSAVYASTGCSDFANFTLVAANDNAIGGSSVSPNYTVCGLTPGATYYFLNSGSSTLAGTYTIALIPIDLNAGSNAGILDLCVGDTVDLFNGITGQDAGGVWTAQLASAGTGVDGNLFNSSGLAYQVFNFQYRLTEGCAYDSVIAQVQIYGPSSAGNDGTVNVCRNEPVNLLSGLSGNIDAGGTWYNPSNQALATSGIVASNIPGQFNYVYITGNGVCPNDSANVLVSVDATCNYLNVEDLFFGAMNMVPNPTTGKVYVSNQGSTEVFNYTVTDMEGRIIATQTAAINGSETTEIDLTGKVTGMYLIRVYNTSAEKVFRVVLQ